MLYLTQYNYFLLKISKKFLKNRFKQISVCTALVVITGCGDPTQEPTSTTSIPFSQTQHSGSSSNNSLPAPPSQGNPPVSNPNTTSVAATAYRGSDAEALLNGFLERRMIGDYYNDFGGPTRELSHVTFNTIPPQTINISTIPIGQTQSRIIRSTGQGRSLITRAVESINEYNSNNHGDSGTVPIVITFRPIGSNPTNCSSIAINENDMERLINSHTNDELFDEKLDAAMSAGARAGIITSELADAVDPTWLTPRPTTVTQTATVDRLRARLRNRIDELNLQNGGYYVNPEHIGNRPTFDPLLPIEVIPVEDIFVHRNSADGTAMLGLLNAIRDQNENEFFTYALALSTGFPRDRITSKEKFIEDFSFLYATFYFPTITDQRQNLHIFLRCGHIY